MLCDWGFESRTPRELDGEDFACHHENVFDVEGAIAWPPRELSVEVQAELSTIVWVEPIPKFRISLYVRQVVCTDKGVAEG